MGWDAISAIGSIGAALVLLVASAAAVIQLKHLRLANQMGSYLDIMRTLNSPEMVAAREYVESHDFEDPVKLQQAFVDGLDHRVLLYGGFYQMVSRLINFGVLDRDLFAPIAMTAPRVWRTVRPIAYEMRKRDPNVRWLDLEYLVYTYSGRIPFNTKRYSENFKKLIGLEPQLEVWLRETSEGPVQS